jgi:hypothetical protein
MYRSKGSTKQVGQPLDNPSAAHPLPHLAQLACTHLSQYPQALIVKVNRAQHQPPVHAKPATWDVESVTRTDWPDLD